MKFIIPYKSKTKNPRAGRYDYQVSGRQTHYLTYNKELPEKDNFRLILENNNNKEYTYIICGYIKQIPYAEYLINYQLSQEIQTLYNLLPEPEWLYEYDNYEVECDWCGAIFDWKKLKSWTDGDEYYYRESDTICPECGEWDCCQIEFQE